MWKLNTSLLQNEDCIVKITSFWLHWKKRKPDFHDLRTWWDIGKKKIKHISVKFSKKKAREKRFQRNVLEARLSDLITSNAKNKNREKIDKIKAEITEIDNKAIAGAKIRSKERFYTEFEKPSHYFFHLEESCQSSKVINSLKKETVTLTAPNDILEELASFYEGL